MRAVRRAALLAGALHAAFVAVVVETPELERMPFDRQRDLQEAIDDAVDLGAEVVRIEAPDVVTGLEQVARAHRATHLVLPHQEVTGLRRLASDRSSTGCSNECRTSRSTSWASRPNRSPTLVRTFRRLRSRGQRGLPARVPGMQRWADPFQ